MGKSSQDFRGHPRQDETTEREEEDNGRSKPKKKKKSKKNRNPKSAKRDTESTTTRGDTGDAVTGKVTPKSGPTAAKISEPKTEEKPSSPSISQPPPPGSHPFEVDDSDHCETPLRAYQDLAVLLDRLVAHKNETKAKAHSNSYSRSSLRIYDPYYCDGGVKTKLASLGFTQVINENRDFYQDIADRTIPDYDVLVTNPPYSGHHMERLLDFCVGQRNTPRARPCFLLLPHFVYTKDYYARALAPVPSPHHPFVSFLVPSVRYSYVPPAWVMGKSGASKALSKGKETTAPFPSFWYCCHLDLDSNSKGKRNANSSNTSNITHEWLEATFGPSGSIVSKDSRSQLRYARTPSAIPRDFKGEFDPTKKRPNPKARKRLRKAAAAAAAGLVVGRAPQQQQPKKRQRQRQRERDPKQKKKRRY